MNSKPRRDEIEQLLNSIPPLATRRHPEPENFAWLGRAANALRSWDQARGTEFSQLFKQFHSQQAHESSLAFDQITALLHEARFSLGDHGAVLSASEQPKDSPLVPDEVFVIHGRQLLPEFHSFLRALGLKPLEWSVARNRTGLPNPYTWQVVDLALRDAGAIVALLTPDDEARLTEGLLTSTDHEFERHLRGQPRQNVLFEAGVAYGRNPGRTLIIRVGSHRPMSDLAGHHILTLDDRAESRKSVADGLSAAGCPVNMGGTDWLRAGKFSLTTDPARVDRSALVKDDLPVRFCECRYTRVLFSPHSFIGAKEPNADEAAEQSEFVAPAVVLAFENVAQGGRSNFLEMKASIEFTTGDGRSARVPYAIWLNERYPNIGLDPGDTAELVLLVSPMDDIHAISDKRSSSIAVGNHDWCAWHPVKGFVKATVKLVDRVGKTRVFTVQDGRIDGDMYTVNVLA